VSVCAHRKWDSSFLCVLVVLISVRALAGGVLVLKGPNNGPHKIPCQEALSGFRQAYRGGIELDKRELSRRLQTDRPALLVAFGREAAETAHQQSGDLPLIVVMVSDPATLGLTSKNVAGISMLLSGDLQLTRFKELLPDCKSIAVIHNPRSGRSVAEAEAAARRLHMHLEDVPVDSPLDVQNRFNLVKPIVNAIWVIPDDFTTPQSVQDFLLEETKGPSLPLVFTNWEGAVAKGALAALILDYRDIGRQCGDLVQQIASGKATVAAIGIRPPETARWVVNTKTASRIGVAIPPDILNSAKIYR
jgi:putative tryptophan/tyrosine transport system substrate-binding protein